MSSSELEHTLLPKVIALPVFSSDALSSVAYATQEITLVLGFVSVAALSNLVPISFAVASLLAIVVISYRQTVRAYPNGGGAYIVAHENLGKHAGVLAAAALLIDYVLTVSVSVTAGVDAIISAAPRTESFKILLVIGFILLVTLANLRGVKESGTFFAIPTYGFILSISVLLVTGFVRCLGDCPTAESAGETTEQLLQLTPFVLLRAFAAGTTALTGVEAISNGVPAFRYPQSRNAAATLTIMGVLSISMFLGISWLANQTQVVYTEHSPRTVVAQIADAIFSDGPMFYVIQVMTAAILILAANTAYADFPRLLSVLALDRFAPRQFINRGDRLVFSNGILILAVLASLLVIAFGADLNRLIQLYLVGVFVSFTLSQAGMVIHWRKTHEPKWKRSAFINAFGAVCTAVVLAVVIATKFREGAYIVVAATPVLMYVMLSIHRHYTELARELEHPERRPADRRPGHQHLIILVSDLAAATQRALGYARSIRAVDLSAVSFNQELEAGWRQLAPEVPIQILESSGTTENALRIFLRSRRSALTPDDFLTLITPELLERRGLIEILRRPRIHRLKGALLREPGIQIMDIPVVKEDVDYTVDQTHDPASNYVIVLVGAVTNVTLQAIEYAETLRPTDIRAVSFSLDEAQTETLGNEWLEASIPHPLEIEASPFRDIGQSLLRYLRLFNADGINRVVTVVIPEFVVGKRRHQILHGQTALIVKRRLLFETGVVVVSVPYHISREAERESRTGSPSQNA